VAYLSASAVVIHYEEALYQVYAPYPYLTLHYSGTHYRVTLCVIAVLAVARCPSVCPSVTLVDCIHMAEDIVKLLVQPGSSITLVF